MKPVGEHVFLKRLDSDIETESGILLKEQVELSPNVGEVVAVGPGTVLENGQVIEPDVNIGDIVYYPRYKEDKIEIDGEEHLVIKYSMILGVKQG